MHIWEKINNPPEFDETADVVTRAYTLAWRKSVREPTDGRDDFTNGELCVHILAAMLACIIFSIWGFVLIPLLLIATLSFVIGLLLMIVGILVILVGLCTSWLGVGILVMIVGAIIWLAGFVICAFGIVEFIIVIIIVCVLILLLGQIVWGVYAVFELLRRGILKCCCCISHDKPNRDSAEQHL